MEVLHALLKIRYKYWRDAHDRYLYQCGRGGSVPKEATILVPQVVVGRSVVPCRRSSTTLLCCLYVEYMTDSNQLQLLFVILRTYSRTVQYLPSAGTSIRQLPNRAFGGARRYYVSGEDVPRRG